MKRLISRMKFSIIASAVAALVLPCTVFAYGISDINKFNDKTISNTNKAWNIKFNAKVDISSVKNSIHMKDLTDNSNLSIIPVLDSDESVVKVNAPSQGYEVGHEYQIIIDKDAKSQKGRTHKKTAVMNFKVIDVSGGNYTASAKVLTSSILPKLKQITISSINLPEVKKFKVDGSAGILDIGKTNVAVIPGNTANVYFYGQDGSTVIAEGTINVANSNNNLTIKLANEN